MNKTIGNIFKGDKVVWIVFFMLCMISLVEVFSASSNLTYKSNNFIMPIMKHAIMLAVGGFIAVVITNIPCRYFKLTTPFLLLISLFTLLWVLFAGESINGANRLHFRELGDERLYLFMTTRNGTVKRLPVEQLKNIRQSGIRALTLDEGDQLISVKETDGNQYILIA